MSSSLSQPLPFPSRPALIGMVHLDALPGAPGFAGDLDVVLRHAAEDARALADGGFPAVMVENFGDTPFFKDDLPPETVAALTRCALAVRAAAPEAVLGINALRNDALAALGVAVAVGARFIRVNVLCGAMVTDQGVIEGRAAEVLRRRAALAAPVAILADLHVKHAAPLAPLAALDMEQAARDVFHRGGADGLIVSGTGTGHPTDPAQVEAVRRAVPGAPVLVGSGATVDRLGDPAPDGYIVGTALKRAGRVDPACARAFCEAVARRARG